MPRFAYNRGDSAYVVELEPLPGGRWRALVDGRPYTVQVQPLADGGWRLLLDEVPVVVYAAAVGDRRYASVGGVHHQLTVARAERRTRPGASAAGRLTAQMPGQIRTVAVQRGERVTRGQTLVVLEAMKMELRITAPADAVVAAVHVQVGAIVERDAPLVDLEALAGA
jgi:biotin carboxyl carrier protein